MTDRRSSALPVRGMARLSISTHMMKQLLDLPSDVEVVGCVPSANDGHTLDLLVTGTEIPQTFVLTAAELPAIGIVVKTIKELQSVTLECLLLEGKRIYEHR